MNEEKPILELPELLRKCGYYREAFKVYVRFQATRLSREIRRGGMKNGS